MTLKASPKFEKLDFLKKNINCGWKSYIAKVLNYHLWEVVPLNHLLKGKGRGVVKER